MKTSNNAIQDFINDLNTLNAKKKIIIVPPNTLLNINSYQEDLQDLIKSMYRDIKQVYEEQETTRYSSRKFQRNIGDTLYDGGQLYGYSGQGKLCPIPLGNTDDGLGQDSRWLRSYLREGHCSRRGIYKLMLLSAFVAIKNPQAYRKLVGAN